MGASNRGNLEMRMKKVVQNIFDKVSNESFTTESGGSISTDQP